MWRLIIGFLSILLAFGSGYVIGMYVSTKNSSKEDDWEREKALSSQGKDKERIEEWESGSVEKLKDEDTGSSTHLIPKESDEETSKENETIEKSKKDKIYDFIKADDSTSVFSIIADPNEIVDLDLEERVLHMACNVGAVEVVKDLISMGADVNVRDKNGNTPLHIATACGRKNIIELLIENGADVNAKTVAGQTPLHIATGRELREIIELFIEKGALVNLKDGQGKKPLDIAMEIGNNRIINLLRTHLEI